MTLVLTDVEGSTRLWAEYPDLMTGVMARHHAIVHGAITAHGGWRPVDQGEGDAVFAAFDSATSALAAVTGFQQQLAAEPWPAGIEIKVRVGIHTGEVTARDGNLFGSTVNRCARLRGLGAGGQVLMSASTWELVRDRLPSGVTVTDLGEHRMKDLTRPEPVHQLAIPGLRSDFPPLASLDRAQHNLPLQTSSFLGRDREVAELAELVTRERLVTITGFGGMGKTRLALQVAAELAVGDGDGVWFVDLSAVTDPAQVPTLIVTTLGIGENAGGVLSGLVAGVRNKRLLLVLDNLEQLLPDTALVVDQIVRAAAAVRVLATSREPLRLAGEHEYPLQPLPVPRVRPSGGSWTEAELGSLSTYAAVSLFITRATAARPTFALTSGNAAAVAAICARLDGLPLALELAAARTRSMSPEALLPRLDHALKVLTGGSRDLPTRHQTLRATIAWSYDALEPNEQQLLDRLSIFPGTFTFDAAEQICGPALGSGEDDLDILDGISALVDRSLLRHHPATDTQRDDRYDLLVSIRDYASERLTATDGAAEALGHRHAAYYIALITRRPGETPEQSFDRYGARRTDLHNLLAAMVDPDTGGAPGEIRLADILAITYAERGLMGEARVIVNDALSRSSEVTLDRVHLLTNRAINELNSGRMTEAHDWGCRAALEARQLGDPSMAGIAAITAAIVSRSRAQTRALISEIELLLETVPESGTSRPRSYLLWFRGVNQNNLSFTDPERAEAAARRQLAAADPSQTRLRQDELAEILLRRGRLEEMETLVHVFEPAAAAAIAEDVQFIDAYGALEAATLRMLQGDLSAARADLRLAQQRLRQQTMPDLELRAAFQQAVLDRVEGDRIGSVRRLTALLEGAPPNIDGLQLARARWLLAVLAREAGDRATAVDLVRQAWSAVAGWDAQFLDLILECLLERAVLITESDPAEAVRMIGLVLANRGDFILLDGVDYDTDHMLADLRTRLGDAEVDRILESTAGQPLPDSPAWTYLPPEQTDA